MFGTLQPLRDEVKLEYGITRDINVTSFVDFYFGEFLLLAQDVRYATDWRTRLAYLVKPPGWAPGDVSHTAANARRSFLADHPELRPTGGPALMARMLPRRARRMTSFRKFGSALSPFSFCFWALVAGDRKRPETHGVRCLFSPRRLRRRIHAGGSVRAG